MAYDLKSAPPEFIFRKRKRMIREYLSLLFFALMHKHKDYDDRARLWKKKREHKEAQTWLCLWCGFYWLREFYNGGNSFLSKSKHFFVVKGL